MGTDKEINLPTDDAKPHQRLMIEKTIYAKRKAVSKEDMQDIFRMEIEHHLRNNPDLQFEGYGEVRNNADRSKTFPIIFSPKPPVAQ